MKLITSPSPLILSNNQPSVFLAGSIESDTAEKWQDIIINQFNNKPITILNPRRDSWDSTWEQSIDNQNLKNKLIGN
jgi:hypothetical protein